MGDIKRIDAGEFRRIGFLQELNRQFLHPLGLALEIVVEEDGSEHFGGVWDYRDDPEGMNYGDGIDEDKARAVQAEWDRHANNRQRALGYVVQPVNA